MKIIEYQAHPGETPFISACIDGRLDIAESLFAQGGVDLNARTDADTSVLEEMVFKTANRPVSFKITKLRGEDVSITDKDEIRGIIGSHPDDEFKTYADIALFVLEKGANPDSANNNGQSAVFTAAGEGSAWLISLLACYGANLNLCDKWGLTALHFACRSGNAEVVRVLLENHANPDLQDDFGFTPAFEAAAGGHLNVLEILAEFGTDFTKGLTKAFKTSPPGTTPLQYAESHGFSKIAEFLRTKSVKTRSIKKSIQSAEWKWRINDFGYEGAKISEGKILWFSHRENQHSSGIGARFQELHDFLLNGPAVSEVPEDTVNEIMRWISE